MPVLTGDELAFVVAGAIVEHQFDVAGEDGGSVGVDGVVELLFDVFETAGDGRRFALGEVEGFFLAVIEEGVVADVGFQRGAEEEVRVEGEQPAFAGESVVLIHAEDFAGGEENHGGIGEVVVFPSATRAAARAFLDEQDGIELEFDGIFFQPVVFEVDERGLRVEGLRTQVPVALAHGFQV